MWEVLLGGSLALLGSWSAIYFQLRYTRKNRMEQIIAEKKIAANAEAYSYIKEAQGLFLQATAEETLSYFIAREEWFFQNRLFFPVKFPEEWISSRNNIKKLVRRERSDNKSPDELENLSIAIEKSLKEAVMAIYKDMDLKPIEFKSS